jgi:hypothetical protein
MIQVRIAIPNLLVLQRFQGITRIILVASPDTGSGRAVGAVSDESFGKNVMTHLHLRAACHSWCC